MVSCLGNGTSSIGRLMDFESIIAERARDQRSKRMIVIDDEEAGNVLIWMFHI